MPPKKKRVYVGPWEGPTNNARCWVGQGWDAEKGFVFHSRVEFRLRGVKQSFAYPGNNTFPTLDLARDRAHAMLSTYYEGGYGNILISTDDPIYPDVSPKGKTANKAEKLIDRATTPQGKNLSRPHVRLVDRER